MPESITITREGDELVVTRPDDERENRALHGLTRSLVANMVSGRLRGLHQRARDRRRRLPRRRRRPAAARPAARLLAPGRGRRARGRRVRGARPDPHHGARASTSSSSARWPPTSARSASPSRTRARASATSTSACCARPASRRSSARESRAIMQNRQVATGPPPPAGPQEGPGHRGASAPRGVPVQQAHLRAGDRRRRAAHARVGVDRGEVVRRRRPARSTPRRRSGKLVGERAKSAGVETVVFDRGGNRYHGRVAGIADGAREAGLTL